LAEAGHICRISGFSVESGEICHRIERPTMSAPTTQASTQAVDPVEAIVPAIPFVLPIVGGVLIFLLAFIAVSMA
jgi:hypothetical protein